MALSGTLSRGRMRPAAEALAFLRWRRATATTAGATPSDVGPLLPEQDALLDCGGSGGGSGGPPEEGVASEASPGQEVAAAKAAATTARAETAVLARRHAEAVEESRYA